MKTRESILVSRRKLKIMQTLSYVDKKIPNKAELHFDDKTLTSKEVTITPPEAQKTVQYRFIK